MRAVTAAAVASAGVTTLAIVVEMDTDRGVYHPGARRVALWGLFTTMVLGVLGVRRNGRVHRIGRLANGALVLITAGVLGVAALDKLVPND